MEDPRYRAAVLIGPPGSGKGTQGQALVDQYPLQFAHLNTGDLFRRKSASDKVVSAVAASVNKGAFLSKDLVTRLLDEEVAQMMVDKCFIHERQILLLDGYPRTLEQIEPLDLRARVVTVLYFGGLDNSALDERMRIRGESQGREDDLLTATRSRRLSAYSELTAPVVEAYRQRPGIL